MLEQNQTFLEIQNPGFSNVKFTSSKFKYSALQKTENKKAKQTLEKVLA